MQKLIKTKWLVMTILYFFVIMSTLSLSSCGGGDGGGNNNDNNNNNTASQGVQNTCSNSGLTSEWMATASCSQWSNYDKYYCGANNTAYVIDGNGNTVYSPSCSGSGLIATVPDNCIDDGGANAGGDSLNIYCVEGYARFCLSGEDCPWGSGSSGGGGGGADGNDSFATAVSLTLGTPTNGTITTGDVDFYKFTASCSGTITVDLTNLTGDIDIVMYNSSQSGLGSSTNSGITNEQITYNASSSGNFYVKVYGYNTATGSYTLKVTGPSCSGSGNPGTDPGAAGDISFTLTWSWSGSTRTAGPDIDIWVQDPYSHLLSSSRDGYSLGPEPEGGVIDYDDMGGWGTTCSGNFQCDGGGPERAYWPTGQSPTGTYTYGVRYYQGDGTANYTLKVYKNSTLVMTKTGSLTAPGSKITLGTVTN